MRLRCAIAALALLLWAAPALAQGCSMCATGANAAGAKSQKSLARGVLVLVIPPVGLMIGMVTLAFRYRRELD